MRKLRKLLFTVGLTLLVLSAAVMFIMPGAAENVVFVDGTAAASGDGTSAATAFKTLTEGTAALTDTGGIIIISGETAIATATSTAACNNMITVTGSYGGTSYGAALKIGANLTLNSPMTFKNITLTKTVAANVYIMAQGHEFVIDEGVTAVPSGTSYLSIVGGYYNATYTGDSSVTIKSGRFRNVYGGNYKGTFNGDARVTWTGGVIDFNISGGGFAGDMNGNAYLDIGGTASFPAVGGNGIVGGIVGEPGGAASVLTGNVYMDIHGDARLVAEACGSGKYVESTTDGDIFITVSENAYIDRNLYAGGYAGGVDGNTSVIMSGGYVGVNLAGGSRTGNVTGDTYVEITGGRIGYLYGGFDVYGGSGNSGAVGGLATVILDGGDVSGEIYGSGAQKPTNGSSVILKSGKVGTFATADGAVAAAAVVVNKSLDIDLSGGGTLSIGKSMQVSSLTGGGTLNLTSGAKITVSREITGAVDITIKNEIHTEQEAIVLLNINGDKGDISLLSDHTGAAFTKSVSTGRAVWTLTCPDCGAETPTAKTVYVDGTVSASGDGLSASGAFATLAEGLTALTSAGGTVVISGNTALSAAYAAPANTKPITITSVCGDADYRSGAVFAFDYSFTMNGEMTFENINIAKNKTGNINIVANGYPITFGDGVVCTASSDNYWYTIIGGAVSGSMTRDSSVTVKSGYFRNIYSSNYTGTFAADSHLTWTGGSVANLIIGGSFGGNFYGNAYLNIGGTARFTTDSAGGITGANLGGTSTDCSFVGDVYIDIRGSANIGCNVFGAGRYGYAHTDGDIHIGISENAYIGRNVYAGGYSPVFNGDTYIDMSGGEVLCNLSGGARSAAMTGNTNIEITGGRVGYYGKMDVSGAGFSANASISGKSTIILDGGDVDGGIYGGGLAAGAVAARSEVILKSGAVGVTATPDGKVTATAGSKSLAVDLSDGGTLTLKNDLSADRFIGGGTVEYISGKVITVSGKAEGQTTLKLIGASIVPGLFMQSDDTASTAVFVSAIPTAFSIEETREGGTVKWSVTRDGEYYNSVRFTVTFPEAASIRLREGITAAPAVITPTSFVEGSGVAVYENLAPGVYNAAVLYTNSDWVRKYVYIDGKTAEYSMHIDLPVLSDDGYGDSYYEQNFDQLLDRYFGTDDLVGFPSGGYTTPTVENHSGTRQYMTNAEMYSYVENLATDCGYMYMFDMGKTVQGYDFPVVVYTKDTIADGATLEQIAETVLSGGDREIFMFVAGVHGNEQTPPESYLAFMSDMCGSYGNSLLSQSRVGAIVMIPRLSLDNAYTFTRLNSVTKVNPNRDFFPVTEPEVQWAVRVYDMFQPTVYIDSHENVLELSVDESGAVGNIDDFQLAIPGTLNVGYLDTGDIAAGDRSSIKSIHPYTMVQSMRDKMSETGLRVFWYPSQSIPGMSTSYAFMRGSFSVLVESRDLQLGKSALQRHMFGHITALKNVIELVMEDGTISQQVAEARRITAERGVAYSGDDLVVLSSSISNSEQTQLSAVRPQVYASGEPVDMNRVQTAGLMDTIVSSRPRATAYLFAADASFAPDILRVLDTHGIKYSLLPAGTTLALRRYTGSVSSAALTAASDVTFAGGAYIVTTDSALGNIISLLFEPDVISGSSDSQITFSRMGIITAENGVFPLYRSEENFISEKLGIGSEAFGDSLAVKGFSIRTYGEQGIRFKCSVDENLKLSELSEKGFETVEYGVLAKAATNTTALSRENAGSGGIGISVSYDKASGIDCVFGKNQNRIEFTSVLMNIPSTHYNTEFAFRGYVVLSDGTESVTIYTDEYGMSISAVASHILDNEYGGDLQSAPQFIRDVLSN